MKNIQKSLAVVARDEKAISPSSHSPYYPFAAASGTGALLKDADGNEYIDYVLGFGPMLLGYCPPAVDRAVAEQLRRGSQFSAPTEDLKRLSPRLVEIITSA